MEFLCSYVGPNFKVALLNPTTLQIVAGVDNDQVCAAINGKWRYIAASINAAHPGGAGGTYDIWITAADNVFTPSGLPPGSSPEIDNTVYAFALAIKATTYVWGGSDPALRRKIGTLTWDGTAITDFQITTGWSRHHQTHEPGGSDPVNLSALAAVQNTQGLLAARPGAAAANTGYLYFATDASGGTLYRSTGSTWTQLASGLTGAPNLHAASHLAAGSDAIAWATVHGKGTLAGRPAAAASNAGYEWLATDVNGGTLYRSDGATWDKEALGVTEQPVVNGGSVASAATIAPANGEFFLVTGTTTIDTITPGVFTTGKVLRLAFTGGPITVRHGVGNVRLNGGLHAGFVANEMLTLSYDGTNWIEQNRSPVYLSGQGGIILNGSTVPGGLLAEDGSAVSRTAYVALFNHLGTTHGAGDGSTTFNLPDARGRMDVGHSPGGHTDVNTIGNNDGVAASFRRPKHRTTNALSASQGGHNHGTGDGTNTVFQVGNPGGTAASSGGAGPGNIAGSGIRAATDTQTPTVFMGGSIGTNNANDPLDSPAYLVRPKYTRI